MITRQQKLNNEYRNGGDPKEDCVGRGWDTLSWFGFLQHHPRMLEHEWEAQGIEFDEHLGGWEREEE